MKKFEKHARPTRKTPHSIIIVLTVRTYVIFISAGRKRRGEDVFQNVNVLCTSHLTESFTFQTVFTPQTRSSRENKCNTQTLYLLSFSVVDIIPIHEIVLYTTRVSLFRGRFRNAALRQYGVSVYNNTNAYYTCRARVHGTTDDNVQRPRAHYYFSVSSDRRLYIHERVVVVVVATRTDRGAQTNLISPPFRVDNAAAINQDTH